MVYVDEECIFRWATPNDGIVDQCSHQRDKERPLSDIAGLVPSTLLL